MPLHVHLGLVHLLLRHLRLGEEDAGPPVRAFLTQ
jgi:hypothetical protein